MTSLLVKILRPSVATACRSSVGMQSLSVRMYGFGSHVSDNDPEVGLQRLAASALAEFLQFRMQCKNSDL